MRLFQRLRGRWTTPALLLLAALLSAGRLHAQDPIIRIRPVDDAQSQWGGTRASPLDVTIDYCHSTSLDPSSRSVTLNDVPVTHLSYSSTFGGGAGCSGSVVMTSTGALTLQPGSNWLRVTICDYVPRCTTQNLEYMRGTVKAEVGPFGAETRVIEGLRKTQVFTITNNGTLPGTFSLSVTCGGPGVAAGSCTAPSVPSVTLNPTESRTESIEYTGGAANSTGWVTLAAGCGADCTPGGATLNVETIAATHGVVVSPQSQTRTVPTATQDTLSFTVRNTGNVEDVYNLNFNCTGAAYPCAISDVSLWVAPGSTRTFTLRYDVGPAGTQGTVTGTIQQSTGPASASVTVGVSSVAQQYGVAVTPDNTALGVEAGAPNTQAFAIRNTGNMPATYSVSGSCVGAAIAGACALSQSSLTLGAGATGSVYVRYPAGSAGTQGTISAVATAVGTPQAASDAGSVTVTAGAVDPGYPGDARGTDRAERGVCLTMPAGPGAAYECGDLRVVHPLPTTRVLNRAFTPALVYNSQTASPTPVVTTEFTPASALSSLILTLAVEFSGGQVTWTRTITGAGWPAGQTRRVSITAPVGRAIEEGVAFRYSLEVRAVYAGGTVQTSPPRTGVLTVVNRSFSPFGSGWWLAGLEQIVSQGDSMKVWVGGDGSARIYRRVAALPNTWVAAPFARADTLRVDPATGEYLRVLPGGVEIRYDAVYGRHASTRNRQGQETRFT
ncbi:MAG TPA: hypothetical protein VGB66_03745, partial [Longimicrobium sp.]